VCWVSPSVFRWIDLWPWLVCGLRQSESCRWRCWRSVCLLQMSWDSFNTRRDAQVGDHLSYLISTSCLHVAVFMLMSWRVWTPGKTSYRIVRGQSSALCFSVIWSDSAITIEPMLLQISVWYNSVFFSWSFKVKPLYCLFFVSLFSSVSAQRSVCPLATDLLPASVTANTGTLLLLLWTEIKAFREQHIVRCSEVKCHRSKSTHSSDSSFGHLNMSFFITSTWTWNLLIPVLKGLQSGLPQMWFTVSQKQVDVFIQKSVLLYSALYSSVSKQIQTTE